MTNNEDHAGNEGEGMNNEYLTFWYIEVGLSSHNQIILWGWN